MPHHRRIREFQRALSGHGIDAAIVNLSRDLFYYTGTAQPCLLVITPSDYRLLVKRAMDFVVSETSLEKEKIESRGTFKDAAACLQKMGVTGGVLGIECDVMPATLYLKLTKLFGDFSIVDMSGIIFHQRMEKDESEIAAIRKACEIMDAGHHRVMETLVPGMTEIELAAEVEYAHRRAGHEGILAMRNFDFYISRGPLCSGDNLFKVSGFSNTITGVGASPAVPAGPSHRKINTGDLVIVDIPTCWKGYHSDQTRTYVLGDPSNEIRDLFQKLRMICDSAVSFLKDGVTSRELFETARKTAEELGVGEYFLGLDPRKGNFIGHGIGLDANEPPVLFDHSDFPLRKDYVLTIEIHLTHPDHGAVKLEDVVRVRENDCERLTLTPRELFGVQVH